MATQQRTFPFELAKWNLTIDEETKKGYFKRSKGKTERIKADEYFEGRDQP